MCRHGALISLLLFLLVSVFLVVPPSLLARGGHGAGITFPAGSASTDTRQKTTGSDFHPYHYLGIRRIERDFNLLLSDSVLVRIGVAVGDTQQAVNDLLGELDYVLNNEFGLPYLS